MNSVTYTVALTPENAPAIDAINKILLSGDYGRCAGTPAAPVSTPTAAPTSTDDYTAAVKRAAAANKAEHGEEFCLSVLDTLGIETAKTLRGSLKNITEAKYKDVLRAWAAGPVAAAPDEDVDDWDDDEEEETAPAKVDPEAVKTAVRAYAKEHGREAAKKVMDKFGAEALSTLEELDAKSLAGLFKAVI
jgi:hypothetical protein